MSSSPKNFIIPKILSFFQKTERQQMGWAHQKTSPIVELKFLTFLLKLTGITINVNGDKNSFISGIFFKFMTGMSMISFFYVFAEVLYCGVISYVKPPVVFFNTLLLFLTSILWINIFRKKTKINELIGKLSYANDVAGIKNSISLKRKMKAIICYACSLPIVASLACSLTIHDKSLEFYLHCYLYGNSLVNPNMNNRKTVFLLFGTIEYFVQFLFPNLIMILIVCLCSQFRQVLEEFTKVWESEIKKSKIDCGHLILKTYGNIRKDFDFLHSTTSFPILVLLAQKFLTLFFSLTVILSADSSKLFTEILESGLFTLNAIISLFLLIMSGARIYETHAKIKRLCLDTLIAHIQREKSFPDINQTELLFLIRTFVEKESMILSAAGLISLKRSLSLQIGAALITYGVLIAQIDH